MAMHFEVILATVPDHVILVVSSKDFTLTHENTIFIWGENDIIFYSTLNIVNFDVLATKIELLRGSEVTVAINFHHHMVASRLEITALGHELGVPTTWELVRLVDMLGLDAWACALNILIFEILKCIFFKFASTWFLIIMSVA